MGDQVRAGALVRALRATALARCPQCDHGDDEHVELPQDDARYQPAVFHCGQCPCVMDAR